MKERLQAIRERALKYAGLVGYPLFYVVCLMIFAALTFPYDKLKQRIVASFNAQQRTANAQQELQIDEMNGYWLSGVKMRGVKLLSAPSEPGKPPSKLQLDEVSLRYGMLAAMVGNSDVSFDVYAFGGQASGSLDVNGKGKALDVTIESMDLGELEPLRAVLGVPLTGKLGGAVRLTLPEGKLSKANGTVSLEAKDVTVGDGKAKIKGAIALPKLDVGALTFAAEAKDGTLKITKFVAGGKDMEVQGEGRITLRDATTDSLCDAQARFKINDAYRTKSDLTKSLFGSPGSSVPPLFELADPKVKLSKRADGFYAWTLRGPISRLEFIPAGGAGVGGGIPSIPGLAAPKVNP